MVLYTGMMYDSLGVQIQSHFLSSLLITPIIYLLARNVIFYLLRHLCKLAKNPKFLVQKGHIVFQARSPALLFQLLPQDVAAEGWFGAGQHTLALYSTLVMPLLVQVLASPQ